MEKAIVLILCFIIISVTITTWFYLFELFFGGTRALRTSFQMHTGIVWGRVALSWSTAVRWYNRHFPDLRVSIFVLALVVSTWQAPNLLPPNDETGNWLISFRNDAVSIAITVLVIDWIAQQRSRNEYKKAIIRQLASRSNDFALEALRISKEEGWLTDGSLNGANLQYANLRGAELVGAVMQGVDLKYAELETANFTEANLIKADMKFAIMSEVKLWHTQLMRSDMRHANLQKADFLMADIRGARLSPAILDNCLSMHTTMKDDNTILDIA